MNLKFPKIYTNLIKSEKTGEVVRVVTEGPLGNLNDVDIECSEN